MDVTSVQIQTTFGPVPNDWDVVALSRLIRSVEYGSSAKSSLDGAVPVLRMGNLQGGKIDWRDLVYTDDAAEIERYSLRSGDVLFNRTNTVDLVGKTSIYRGEQPAIFAGYLIRINVSPGALDSRFLNYVLNAEFSRKYSAKVLSVAVSQANINGQKLKTFPIPLPPTKQEQERIAEALSDADALIESLEQLLVKKRKIKQGAMQELLAGRMRLSGFKGEWERRSLGALGKVTGAGVDKKIQPDQVPVRLVNYMDVYRMDFIRSSELSHWVTAPLPQARRCAVERGDVFFTPSSETRDDIANSAVAMESIADAAYSYHVVRLRPVEPFDLHFSAYAFKSNAFLRQAETLCDGGGTRYVLSLARFRAISIEVPPLREQVAIGEFLLSMDNELVALECKLAKTRQIKQGMMQELLTGRIRLV